MMGNLWFQNRWGQERLIANVNSPEEVYRSIHDFIDQCNENNSKRFVSHYMRTWEEDGRTKIDVGSWTEFFYTDISLEEE